MGASQRVAVQPFRRFIWGRGPADVCLALLCVVPPQALGSSSRIHTVSFKDAALTTQHTASHRLWGEIPSNHGLSLEIDAEDFEASFQTMR